MRRHFRLELELALCACYHQIVQLAGADIQSRDGDFPLHRVSERYCSAPDVGSI